MNGAPQRNGSTPQWLGVLLQLLSFVVVMTVVVVSIRASESETNVRVEALGTALRDYRDATNRVLDDHDRRLREAERKNGEQDLQIQRGRE